jgi:hypothetical protein
MTLTSPQQLEEMARVLYGASNGRHHAESSAEPSRLDVINLTEFSRLKLALREFVLAPFRVRRLLPHEVIGLFEDVKRG